jgi:hypothetical protein
MRAIGKKQKGHFSIFRVKFSLGYITIQEGLLCWLVSRIMIGLVTLMIKNLLQVLFLVLLLGLSLGLVRSCWNIERGGGGG